jgi:hypothetical protein
LGILVTSVDTLRFDIVDNIMLVVHADAPPSEPDWARLMMVRNANRQKIRGTLVVAPPRATINANQRADVVSFMKETGTGVTLLTESVLVRGVARAVAVLGVKVQAFAMGDGASAFDSLAVPRSRHADLSKRIEVLKKQLASSG